MLKIGILCLLSSAAVIALPTDETRNTIAPEGDGMDNLYNKFFTLVDKTLERHDRIELSEGVTIVRNPNVEKEGSPRSSSVEDKISNYFNTHTIKAELKGAEIMEAVASTGRSLEDFKKALFDSNNSEARGKKKKAGKVLGPIILAVALKAAALIPVALGAIALIAGKALLIGKIALVLSAVIGLKKLLSQEKHVTYEVVAHPHHTSSHSSSHSDAFGGSGFSGDVGGGGGGSSHGWGRSGDAHNLAYKGHADNIVN